VISWLPFEGKIDGTQDAEECKQVIQLECLCPEEKKGIDHEY
jgi:hypothetical protein